MTYSEAEREPPATLLKGTGIPKYLAHDEKGRQSVFWVSESDTLEGINKKTGDLHTRYACFPVEWPVFPFTASAGEQISEEKLFQYSNGRFLVNEEYELAKRYSPFNVDALCHRVSSLPTVQSPIVKINKKEGGYNKAVLMTAQNGRTVLAKIPCRNIVPRQYGTASEVAVLELVKTRSRIPVSEVLAWNADASDSVQSEYIVLEKSGGQQLTQVWDTLKESDRVGLIRSFAQLASKLANIEFPGYGALYLRDGLPSALRAPGRTIDVDETYCLGPAYHGSWPGGFAADPEEYAQHSGPWRTLRDVGIGLAQQGIVQVESYKTSYAGRGPYYGTPEDHVDTLRTAMKAINAMADSPTLLRHAQPVLCHPDFHPGNIFVSQEDPTNIINIIDWQFTSVMPRFTQVRWPLFLTPPEGYRTGVSNPELLPQYDDGEGHDGHDANERKQAEALRTKCYEAALVKTHLESYLALTEIDVTIRHLFTSCSTTYREGVVPLRESLIKIFQNWSQLGLQGTCPYHFPRDVIVRHENQIEEYRAWLRLREYTHELLRSNDGGWVPPHVNFEDVRTKHDKMYQHFLRSKKDRPEEDTKKLWFFRERG